MRPAEKTLPEATLERLTLYRRVLERLGAAGLETVSSEVLADAAGVNPAILRKDLSMLGSFGRRGVGYGVMQLAGSIATTLGLNNDWRVGIVGAGNLGRALAGYAGFRENGFRLVGLYDADASLVGRRYADLVVADAAGLEDAVLAEGINMAVLAVPAAAAQELCDRLVAAGVRNILNFAPVVLQVPPDVVLRKVDMARELQLLAYYATTPGSHL
ncbi:redox-sensing transcriptional repressor Rex [Zafaria sp. Z1313]|uniref:redox-sensing transcriptional repressor Rex n=1 Tax=unclassified Zafaria TaxID=2828765 RepID=UPI002E75B6D5|nr:redox-sensing transcriptional repressor Rex [Zafaria sp. J156]MEE1621323.1 redox-sensing transcriptional repressor Rex [Zafaria sp. J156]